MTGVRDLDSDDLEKLAETFGWPVQYVIGMFLGYPECCIVNFFDRLVAFRKGRLDDEGKEFKLANSGYVPCPVCNATKSEKELLETINTRRLSSVPFPDFEVD